MSASPSKESLGYDNLKQKVSKYKQYEEPIFRTKSQYNLQKSKTIALGRPSRLDKRHKKRIGLTDRDDSDSNSDGCTSHSGRSHVYDTLTSCDEDETGGSRRQKVYDTDEFVDMSENSDHLPYYYNTSETV